MTEPEQPAELPSENKQLYELSIVVEAEVIPGEPEEE